MAFPADARGTFSVALWRVTRVDARVRPSAFPAGTQVYQRNMRTATIDASQWTAYIWLGGMARPDTALLPRNRRVIHTISAIFCSATNTTAMSVNARKRPMVSSVPA
eukprot:401419_1